MAFCTSCGAASNTTAAFCPSCGAKTQAPSQVAPASTPPAPTTVVHPVAVEKAGAPWTKILIIVGVLMVAGVAALAYGAYWMKNKVQATAAAYGITMPADTSAKTGGSLFSGAASEASSKRGPIPDACSLFTKEDADAVLGEPMKLVDHEENDKHSSHCNYRSVAEDHGANGFGVEIHSNESVDEARQGQAIKKGLYSNVTLYTFEELSGYGDASFLVVNKGPEGEGFKSGPLAAMVAHQEIQMTTKGTKDIEILVTYFGSERSSDGLKALTRKLADKIQ
jgi:hypothetical protein